MSITIKTAEKISLSRILRRTSNYVVYAMLIFGIYFVSSLFVDVLANNRCVSAVCMPS
ncbi:hypothetical protein [Candidatus Nitrosotenuis sp. DW1]|uniref:hypothetical protein n=1 Tax=Candidatus Nitrosotenuis sp. DW1 TaxID=2259672 RepID=UPI0015CC4AD6|nr:hypothetical protein [Candidatus Nitrosotenuis sp. DW1]